MTQDVHCYDALPWRVVIDPERQDDGRILFVAFHPEFDGVLGGRRDPRECLSRSTRGSPLDD